MSLSTRRCCAALLLVAVAPATTTTAQTGDPAYCTQLAGLVQRYMSTAGMDGGHHRTPTTLWALEQCNGARASEAITVLEKVLRDNRFTLPGR